jgi:hypothetical protein
MYLALDIQHEMRMYRIATCDLSGSTTRIHIISWRARFWEKNIVERKARFDFLYNFCLKHLTTTTTIIIITITTTTTTIIIIIIRHEVGHVGPDHSAILPSSAEKMLQNRLAQKLVVGTSTIGLPSGRLVIRPRELSIALKPQYKANRTTKLTTKYGKKTFIVITKFSKIL